MAYNIRKIREEKKLTQQKLAELSNCSEVAISNIEKEKSWPKDTTLENIALALGVKSIDFFVDTRLDEALNKIEKLRETVGDIQTVLDKFDHPKKVEYNISHGRMR